MSGRCARCATTFTLNQPRATTCSPRCARALAKERYRARKTNAFVANVNRNDIYRRDNWTCQLCSLPLAMDQQTPHPEAPVIDHVIPLARGGTHEPSNTQAAHFLCNSIKSDTLAA